MIDYDQILKFLSENPRYEYTSREIYEAIHPDCAFTKIERNKMSRTLSSLNRFHRVCRNERIHLNRLNERVYWSV